MCHLYVITGCGADSDEAGCHQQDQARVRGVLQVTTCPVLTCVCLSECFNIVNVFFIYTSKSMKFNGITSKFNTNNKVHGSLFNIITKDVQEE